MNVDITRIIDQYIHGELSEADHAVFEKRLTENPALQEEVALQQSIHEAANRAALRTQVKQTGKHYHFTRNLLFTGLSLFAIFILVTVTLFIGGKQSSAEALLKTPGLLQNIEKKKPIKHLASQFFAWNGQDSVMITEQGVLLSIPENAWLLKGEPYSKQAVILWQEALDGATIMKSGLSTMSGDQLLETQGMFGIKAYTPSGEELSVNPKTGIYVQVPVDQYRRDMQLFEGKENAAGIIDWKNPKPLLKIPLPVDMQDLSFYPVGYEDSLNTMKLRRDKKYRDSLYLSFAKAPLGSELAFQSDSVDHSHGKSLFLAKCQTCHATNREGTGPALAGVRNKWANGGARPGSIYKWVQDWESAAYADPYARSVSGVRPTAMQRFPELTPSDLDAIFDYADNSCSNFIDPAKVLGFWRPQFNNTNLATREFEKRMREVHATCDDEVLEIYTRNLDKPLWKLDKQVAEMGYWIFGEFAAEQVGKVNISNPHLKQLAKFYEQTVSRFRKEVQEDLRKILKGEKQWDQEIQADRTIEQLRTDSRNQAAYVEEYEFNLTSAYKQLGKRKPEFRQLRKTVGFTITSNAAIYNIDRFVTEVTAARKSGTFTDKETGKQAKVTYSAFSFEVQPAGFSNVYAYLIPVQLNSYQRISGNNNRFSYDLNNGMEYNLIVLGISEKGYAWYRRDALNDGALGKITLQPISEKALNAAIEQMNLARILRWNINIADDLYWLSRQQQDYMIQKNRIEQTLFRKRISRIIFPCMCEDLYAGVAASDEAL